jgi:hypothetical protein
MPSWNTATGVFDLERKPAQVRPRQCHFLDSSDSRAWRLISELSMQARAANARKFKRLAKFIWPCRRPLGGLPGMPELYFTASSCTA